MLSLLFALLACAPSPTEAAPASPPVVEKPPAEPDIFHSWLSAPAPVADGFSLPVDSGWSGCGAGCWRRSSPGPVRAIAQGEVVEILDDGLVLAHQLYEDQHRRQIRSVYRGVSPSVRLGRRLDRGEELGRSTILRLDLEGTDEPAETWIQARRTLFVPQQEPVLALVSHDLYQMRIYRDGVEAGRYNVSFGQEKGDKERRGDNRSPKGMYFVVLRSKGPFSGPVGPFYGGHWIKLSYPNAWDAARGVDQGLISVEQQRRITSAWRSRQMPLQDTSLGGGIGFHGWAEEWRDEGPRHLSWGCIVLHLSDVAEVYEHLSEGAMVVLF